MDPCSLYACAAVCFPCPYINLYFSPVSPIPYTLNPASARSTLLAIEALQVLLPVAAILSFESRLQRTC